MTKAPTWGGGDQSDLVAERKRKGGSNGGLPVVGEEEREGTGGSCASELEVSRDLRLRPWIWPLPLGPVLGILAVHVFRRVA